MTVPDTNLASLPIPLAIEIRRRALRGVLADPRPWLDALVVDLGVSAIVAAFEAEASRGDRVFDTGRWAMEDLPDSEVHLLDPVGDMVGALNWILLIKGARDLDLGPSISRLASVAQSQAEGLPGEAERLGTLLRLPDAPARTEALRLAWLSGLARAKIKEQALLHEAPIDRDFVSAVEMDVNERRATEPLRSLLTARDVVRFEVAAPPESAIHTFNSLVPKLFFVNDPRNGASASDFGSSFSRGLGLRETGALVRKLMELPTATFLGVTQTDRMAEAREVMRARDIEPDAFLLPDHAALMIELTADQRFAPAYPRASDGSIGSFAGVPVYILPLAGLRQGWLLQIGAAIRERVLEVEGRRVRVVARNADSDEATKRPKAEGAGALGDTDGDANVLVAVSEAFEFEVRQAALLAIPLEPRASEAG